MQNVEGYFSSGRISKDLPGHEINKMAIVDKMRKKTMKKSGRRYCQAERKVSTKGIKGRMCQACQNSRRASPIGKR